jgi:hypothetical protein
MADCLRKFWCRIVSHFLFYLPCWGTCLQQFTFYLNWYFAESVSWHELNPPRNLYLDTVYVGDPMALALQNVVCRSGEIQHQVQETILSASSSAPTNKRCYSSHFQQSTEGFKCKNCGEVLPLENLCVQLPAAGVW